MNPAILLLGPLAGPECRRALGRGWLILVRTLAASALALTTLGILWFWWMRRLANPSSHPFSVFTNGLVLVEGMATTLALVFAPAVLAGSLAGEKERGALGLLLTTNVPPREIVSGRMAGKLAQVTMILAACFPAVVLLGALAGLSGASILVLIGLPMAVAIGGAGLATAVSAVSRRGRDALVTVYLIDLLFLLAPLTRWLGLPIDWADWLSALNPYACLNELVWYEERRAPGETIGLWLVLGLLGAGFASWRLAPSCLSQLDGARVGRRWGRGSGRRALPPLDDERPMRWKELYVERAATLGGLGWWIGAALTLGLAVGSLVCGGLIVADWISKGRLGTSSGAELTLKIWVGGSGSMLSWLIQWAVGLRAAVSIASERERGTWEALLTSPLEPRAILRAKLGGSLHALRGLFAAALLAWTIAWSVGAIKTTDYLQWVIGTMSVGAFMGAVGVRTSLSCATATKAMAVTIGIWLGAFVVVGMVASLVVALATTILVFTMMPSMMTAPGALPGPAAAVFGRWMPIVTGVAWLVTTNLIYLIATASILATTRYHFDELAGRVEPRRARRAPMRR